MEQLLNRIRDGLTRGVYPNERAVSTSIVVPILRELGWDDSDPEQVLPEHSTGRGRVDYALRCPPQRPVAFIEVKGIGRSSEADRQLFEYAFHEGVPLAVLTDGREWNFYVPAQQGSYSDRRAYQLVLDERDVDESMKRFRRYLQRERLASGDALNDAIRDYKDARSRREAMDMMPQAWSELLAEPDPILIEAVLERTEALCGFRPDQEQASSFLRNLAPPDATVRPRREPRRAMPTAPEPERVVAPVIQQRLEGRHTWFVMGQSGAAQTGVEAFVAYLDALFAASPDRHSHMIAAARTRSRNNIAANLADVYPTQPERAAGSNRRLANGLYVGTNLSNASKVQLARQVAMAAGLNFGTEARLELAG